MQHGREPAEIFLPTVPALDSNGPVYGSAASVVSPQAVLHRRDLLLQLRDDLGQLPRAKLSIAMPDDSARRFHHAVGHCLEKRLLPR